MGTIILIFLGYIIFEIIYKSITEKKEPEKDRIIQNEPISKSKLKGDAYELCIGRKCETKDDLVIYHGLIKGKEDKGVDIISINTIKKEQNLIQCKNWTNKYIFIDDIIKIYDKLTFYENIKFKSLHLIPAKEINIYTLSNKNNNQISDIIYDSRNYKFRKTLYLSTTNTIKFDINKYFTKIHSDIYKYKDMKIVIQKFN